MLLQNVQDELAEILLTEDGYSDLVLPAENIIIYRNNMITSLMKTLTHVYEMIIKLVGNDFFEVLAREYINRYPSTSGNLHDYGEYFGDFLAEYPPVKNLPYLAEMANLEWVSHLLQFASDADALQIKSLETIPPEQFHQLYFILHPASRLMKFQYPILRILDLCTGEIDEEINMHEGGLNLLVIRPEAEIMLVRLSDAEFAFLSAISRNESLGAALDDAMQIDASFKLDECLPKWIQNKTIVDFQ